MKIFSIFVILGNLSERIMIIVAIFFGLWISTTWAAPKPNFILIVADDLGYGDLSITGSKQIQTPHIDSIAQNGVFFSNGYVTSAVCAPSRAGLLTGIHPMSFGFQDNLAPVQPGHDPAWIGLPKQVLTIADRLKQAGHTSGIIGKWHLGEMPHFHPTKRGFDEFWGYLGGGHDYFVASEEGTGMKCRIESNFKTQSSLTYLTDDQGNECVDFIRRNQHKPFFLYASFAAPHSPMQAKPEDLEKFSHISDQLRRTYCAMVYRLDINVGKILSELREQQLEKNTIVIFLSDNGGPCSPGIANGACNAPFHGGKTTVFEGGIRVPILMKYPAILGKNLVKQDLVSAMDIAPTILDAAGILAQQQERMQGISLLPLLQNEETEKKERSFYWNYTVGSAVREGEWKLLQRVGRMPQLFHIKNDPGEKNDLSARHPAVTKELVRKLGDWQIKSPNPVFREPGDWRMRHHRFYDASYNQQQPEP